MVISWHDSLAAKVVVQDPVYCGYLLFEKYGIGIEWWQVSVNLANDLTSSLKLLALIVFQLVNLMRF